MPTRHVQFTRISSRRAPLNQPRTLVMARIGFLCMALRAGDLGPDELALVLELLNYSQQVAARIRAQQAQTETTTDAPGETSSK